MPNLNLLINFLKIVKFTIPISDNVFYKPSCAVKPADIGQFGQSNGQFQLVFIATVFIGRRMG